MISDGNRKTLIYAALTIEVFDVALNASTVASLPTFVIKLKVITLNIRNKTITVAAFALSLNSYADTKHEETRYCYGDKRDPAVVASFKNIHPCPVTGLSNGPCPGWSVDHVIPLAVGGCDSVSNLQWLPNEIKSCAGTVCKDRWERKVYERVIVVD